VGYHHVRTILLYWSGSHRAASIVHVTYKGGESEYPVAPDAPVLAYVLADRRLLKPGAGVVTIAVKQPDGSLLSTRVTAEKNGVKPPM
jgi:hypothetical protein